MLSNVYGKKIAATPLALSECTDLINTHAQMSAPVTKWGDMRVYKMKELVIY
jgi:hypothetical protein